MHTRVARPNCKNKFTSVELRTKKKLKEVGSDTYRHPVTIHKGEFIAVVDEPPLWLKLIRVVTPYLRVTVFYPAVDANNCLWYGHMSTVVFK
jgi:hypothetical protein